MPREMIERYLQDPWALGIAAAVAVILLISIVWLVLRSRKGKSEKESRIREKLVAMERETQFASAAEQTKFQDEPQSVAREIARAFGDYLALPVLAIYAGREGDDTLRNILPSDDAAQDEGPGRAQVSTLPAEVPRAITQQYSRPQLARTSAFLPAASSQAPGALEQSRPETGPEEAQAASEITKPDRTTSPLDSDQSLAVLPWSGPFGWNGVIAARSDETISSESLSKYREPLARLSNRLAVALELDKKREALDERDEREAQATGFFRSLISSLDSPTPFAAVTRDLAGLVDADSAALWRVEPGTSMIRMIASYGLKSAEFLPLPIGEGLAGTVAKTGEPIDLEDAPSDPRCLFPREARESGMVGYLAVPLSDDASSGVVEVHSSRPRRWTDDERKTLERVASVIGDVIKGSDSRGNRLRVESSYLGLSEAMQRLRSPDEVKEAAAEVLGHALGVSRAVFVDFGDGGQPEPIKYEYLVANVHTAVGASLPADLPGRVGERSEGGEPVAINDSRSDSLMGTDAAASLQVLSEMAIPVKIDGKLRGAVYLHQCDRVRDWQREEVDFADRVGRQLSLTLSNLTGLDSATKSRDAARDEARRASEAAGRAQALISALPESVIGLDKEGRVTFFNAAAREFLGLRNEDLGHMAEMTEALSLSDDAIWAGINDAQQVSRFEAQLSRTDPVPVSIAVAPVRNKGEIAGKVVVVSNLSHIESKGESASARISELESRASDLQQALDQARAAEADARATAARNVGSGNTDDLRQQLERLRQDEDRLRRSAQQLLEINRLKSEFIVNAGHELESSVQSVMGFAELLEQGSYGPLTAEQAEAVKGIYAWSRRMKSDIDWLIEYGSTRSRRLDAGEKAENTKPLF